jgi:hypothetical protein
MDRRRVGSLVLSGAFFLTLFTGPLQSARAVVCSPGQISPPQGRPYFVISVGRFVSGETNGWAKLAQYTFSCGGAVSESLWFWRMGVLVNPNGDITATGEATGGCDNPSCGVHTACGFETNNTSHGCPNTSTRYPTGLSGTYTNSGSTLVITWSTGATETWQVRNLLTISRLTMDLASAPSGRPTFGRGWGSTQKFTVGFTADGIFAKHGIYGPFGTENDKVVNNYGAVSGPYQVKRPDGQLFTLDFRTSSGDSLHPSFKRCNSKCLTRRGVFTGCGTPAPPDITEREDLVTFRAPSGSTVQQNPRRTAWSQECTQHAKDAKTVNDPPFYPCTHAGHLFPMLQVIDDLGNFRGFVGVEGSEYSNRSGGTYAGSFEYVDVSPTTS